MAVLQWLGKIWVIVTAVIGSFILLGCLAIFFFLKNGSSEVPSAPPVQKVLSQHGTDKVAVIPISGEILETDGEQGFLAHGQVAASERIVRLIDAVANDSSVKAVVLRMNTPGGSVVASDEIYQHVKKLRDKKPVVTSMSDVAASGGYYIAAGSSKIVANPATITGSIGVIAELPKFSGLFDKLGVDMRVIKSGQFKDMGSMSRDLTPEEQTIFQTMINQTYDQFVHAVVSGRNMDEAKVRQLADGRIYSGLQAQQNGLVDRLGNFDDAVAEAEQLAHISNTSVVEYSDQTFWQSLFQSKISGLSFLSALSPALPQEKFGFYYLLSVGNSF